MRDLSLGEIDAIRAGSVWDLGNKVLYDLCRKNPEHKNLDAIIAKIWLIGRSYAASIERRKNAENLGGDFYLDDVAPALKRSRIDAWLASLESVTESGHPDTIVIHKQLTDLFLNLTNLNKRSLASKYLHFHKPHLFFIYDSRARQGIMKFTPRISFITDFNVSDSDWEYKDFVRRCLWLRHRVKEQHGILLTPRQIDNALLALGQ